MPSKNIAGRTIASRLANPSTSYTAALMSNPRQQHHPGQSAESQEASRDQQPTPQFTAQTTCKESSPQNTPLHKDAEVRNAPLKSGQSVQANSTNNSTLNDMFKVAAIVQQIMTELNGAVTEEHNIVAITRIVLNLMKENGH